MSQSNVHITAIYTEKTTGVCVTSAMFSPDVRLVVFGTAKSLLSELDESTVKHYLSIQRVAETFNTQSTISSAMIRNAIRILDMRITHCESQKKLFEMIPNSVRNYTTVFCSEPQLDYFTNNFRGLVAPHYTGVTAVTMKTVRQILVDSLITITPEFE